MEVSAYLGVIVVAWAAAQGLKYIFAVAKHRRVNVFRQLYLSGNMPSAHTAATVSLVTLVGLREGTDTAIFAVAALLAAIVMYDSIMVRRSAGEQGLAIGQLIDELKSHIHRPRSAKGHTPLEVVAGAVLGIVIAFVMFLVTK